MSTVDFEGAFDAIVSHLKSCSAPVDSSAAAGNYGCDLWIPALVQQCASASGSTAFQYQGNDGEKVRWHVPFYDAAAELCRIGVLRPGQRTPMGQSMQAGFHGDGYSLTSFGRQWSQSLPESKPRDPSRLMALLQSYGPRFGTGYLQRSAEAVGCYRSGYYLATCVMCGAAAESILLATAIAKLRDEDSVLKDYRSSSGRKKLTDAIARQSKTGVRDQLETFVRLLGFWRDDAGHGRDTKISEAEANFALMQLLRFSQFANDEWDILTS